MTLQVTGIDPLRGQELLDRINRIARHMNTNGERRSMDQLRADIATDLLCGTTHPTIGTVHLTVDPARLADPDVHSAVTLFLPPRPQAVWGEYGEAGRGAVPTHDGPRERWSTSSLRSQPPSKVRCASLRSSHGLRPGGTDTTPYSHSRWTETIGLAPLCRKDHRIRHKAGWTYTIHPDRTITWHSPLGTTYHTNNRDP